MDSYTNDFPAKIDSWMKWSAGEPCRGPVVHHHRLICRHCLLRLRRRRRVRTLIQVFLVNASDLYVYNGADIWGVNSWIPVRRCQPRARTAFAPREKPALC